MQLNYLFNSYHILNILAILTYFPIRQYCLKISNLKQPSSLQLTKESTTIFLILLLLVLRNRNFYSKAQFFDKIYVFSKVCENYLVLGYYTIGCFLLWIINKYPKYKGPTKLAEIDQENFISIQKQMKDSNELNYLFLVCYAPFSHHCYYFSNMYSHEQFLFCSVNVATNQTLADQLRINVSGYSRQLPSVILFKNGDEVQRFPAISEEGIVGKVLKYDKVQLEKFFKFKEILLDIYNSSSKKTD